MSTKDSDTDFLEAMKDVSELGTPEKITSSYKTLQSERLNLLRVNAQNPPEEDSNTFLDYVREFVLPDEYIQWKQSGVQPGDFKNLQAGIYQAKMELDLHQKSVKEARILIWEFVNVAISSEQRTIKIVHGRGYRSDPPAVLKSFVVQCLKSHPEVIAYCTTPSHLGGTGATFVQVKKSASEREKTRESLGLKSS